MPIFVTISGDALRIAAEIRRLAQWPAVFAIILDCRAVPTDETVSAARNTPLATCFDAEASQSLPAWANLAILHIPQADSSIPSPSGSTIPIITVRRLLQVESIPIARTACDHLQFDLAMTGDFAG